MNIFHTCKYIARDVSSRKLNPIVILTLNCTKIEIIGLQAICCTTTFDPACPKREVGFTLGRL